MENLLRFLVSIRVFLLFIGLEVMALILISTSSYYQQSVILSTVQAGRSVLHMQVSQITQYLDLKSTNKLLSDENTALRNELAHYRFTHDADITTKFDSTGKALFTYIPANIIDNSVNKQHNFIVLDVGSEDGVAPDMGVITEQGVIGIVMAVTEHCSFVKSLLHTEWKCNVRLLQAGDFGPLQWDGLYYNESILHDIPQHSNVQIGDTVITSGYSSIFPLGIPVGTVKAFHTKRGNFYEVRIRLFADFKKIQHVNVVSFLYQNELKTLNQLRDEY
jgi:rod shape-determining protein MreC